MSQSNHDDLPEDIKALLVQTVRSVGHLETLLFVYEHRDQKFTAEDLSRELRSNEAYALNQLRELALLVSEADARFQFKSSDSNNAIVQKLTDLYRERRHAIINYIYSKPPDALLSFADAFRLKK